MVSPAKSRSNTASNTRSRSDTSRARGPTTSRPCPPQGCSSLTTSPIKTTGIRARSPPLLLAIVGHEWTHLSFVAQDNRRNKQEARPPAGPLHVTLGAYWMVTVPYMFAWIRQWYWNLPPLGKDTA